MQQIIDPKDFESKIDPKKVSLKKKKEPVAPVTGTIAVEDFVKKPWYTRLKNFVFGTILTKKSPQENILGYLFRQLLLVDSTGKPSVTNTMTWLSIVMTYYWFKWETKIALSDVVTKTDTTTVTAMKGYSEYFYVILSLIISAVLAMYYKRAKRNAAANGQPEEPGIIETAKQFIASKFGPKP